MKSSPKRRTPPPESPSEVGMPAVFTSGVPVKKPSMRGRAYIPRARRVYDGLRLHERGLPCYIEREPLDLIYAEADPLYTGGGRGKHARDWMVYSTRLGATHPEFNRGHYRAFNFYYDYAVGKYLFFFTDQGVGLALAAQYLCRASEAADCRETLLMRNVGTSNLTADQIAELEEDDASVRLVIRQCAEICQQHMNLRNRKRMRIMAQAQRQLPTWETGGDEG